MGRRRPTLATRDVRRILTRAGFTLARTRGDHEQWVAAVGGRKYLVTLDVGGEPFTDRSKLLKAMIAQSGFTADEFYALLDD